MECLHEVSIIEEITICEICGKSINKIDYKKHLKSHQTEKKGKLIS